MTARLPLLRAVLTLLLASLCPLPGQAATDKIDLPFQDDPGVLGTWRSVAFVRTPDDFSAKGGPAGGLFLKELVFLPQGRTPSPDKTWTQGLVLDSQMQTASRYTFQELDGLRYMFFEWKSGDYVFRGAKPYYYVLKKK